MNKQLTLGSLFDGSGAFPLGAICSGIKPIWASETEPFCVRVTTKRLPEVKHLGDIRNINGAEIEPADIITSGSPCQNLSIAAGRRSGLSGEKSSLFFEAIRVVKEMRNATKNKPRFLVWENVPGAFSSNHGEDFRTVLEEIVGIVAPCAQVPAADPHGWPSADILVGDGWSIAYRVCDAQHFGVPQRRKRIFLVADFGSERAGEILFERVGMRRDFAPSCSSQPADTGTAASGVRDAVAFMSDLGCQQRGIKAAGGISPTLLSAVGGDDRASVVLEFNPTDSRIKIDGSGTIQTLTRRMGTGGNTAPLVMSLAGNIIDRDIKNGGNGIGWQNDISYTLTAADRHGVAFAIAHTSTEDVGEDLMPPLKACDAEHGAALVCPADTIVRRITTLEASRL